MKAKDKYASPYGKGEKTMANSYFQENFTYYDPFPTWPKGSQQMPRPLTAQLAQEIFDYIKLRLQNPSRWFSYLELPWEYQQVLPEKVFPMLCSLIREGKTPQWGPQESSTDQYNYQYQNFNEQEDYKRTFQKQTTKYTSNVIPPVKKLDIILQFIGGPKNGEQVFVKDTGLIPDAFRIGGTYTVSEAESMKLGENDLIIPGVVHMYDYMIYEQLNTSNTQSFAPDHKYIILIYKP